MGDKYTVILGNEMKVMNWSKLAQIFFGIIAGYLIVKIMLIISTLSMIWLIGIGLSGGSASFISWLMAWGLFLIGLIVASTIGVISNMLLIAFVPISGVISSLISTLAAIYYILQLAASFLF